MLELVLLTSTAVFDVALLELTLVEVDGAGVMVEEWLDEWLEEWLELELELLDVELEDEAREEVEEEEEEVELAVEGKTRLPAVTVKICPPISEAPLNVVVEDVAVDVMVPRTAFMLFVQTP